MRVEFETASVACKPFVDAQGILDMIAECAYYKAETRGFAPGFEEQDWIDAEQEVGLRCFYWLQD